MRKLIFILGYFFGNSRVLIRILYIKIISKKNKQQVYHYKQKKMKKYLINAYENTVYYKECFDYLNFNPYEFKDIKELEKIPILTKEIIKKRPEDFYSKKVTRFKVSKSGGSTGEPLVYRMSYGDAAWSRALLFNGFSYAGYKFGDAIFTIAGGSIVSNNRNFRKNLVKFILNSDSYFALKMSEKDYDNVIKTLNLKKPKFIRGYSQVIYRIAKYMEDSNLGLIYKPKAVFTTAETLSNNQRKLIENMFNTKLYDHYGLNDSGASAYEIDTHEYLVDFERSYIELITEDNQERIISTSYNNEAMYFIRYDTGDLAIKSDDKRRNKITLRNIQGRTSDVLEFNKVNISIARLSILLAEINVNRYQILNEENSLTLLYSGTLSNEETDYIYKLFNNIFLGDYLKIKNVSENEFILTKNGKHQTVIKI